MASEQATSGANLLRPGSFLTRADATKTLVDAGIPLSRGTLDYWATKGTGPRFTIRNGRAVYARRDLEAWISESANT